jgi:hypothetical protein
MASYIARRIDFSKRRACLLRVMSAVLALSAARPVRDTR